jgi:hypothetical protein
MVICRVAPLLWALVVRVTGKGIPDIPSVWVAGLMAALSHAVQTGEKEQDNQELFHSAMFFFIIKHIFGFGAMTVHN